MKQFEVGKKDLVGKLREELDTVEFRFLRVINENNMTGEDFRQIAWVNLQKYKNEQNVSKKLQERIDSFDAEL